MNAESKLFTDCVNRVSIFTNIFIVQLAVLSVSKIVVSVFAAGNRTFGKCFKQRFVLKNHLFIANSFLLHHGINQHCSHLGIIIPHKLQNINRHVW